MPVRRHQLAPEARYASNSDAAAIFVYDPAVANNVDPNNVITLFNPDNIASFVFSTPSYFTVAQAGKYYIQVWPWAMTATYDTDLVMRGATVDITGSGYLSFGLYNATGTALLNTTQPAYPSAQAGMSANFNINPFKLSFMYAVDLVASPNQYRIRMNNQMLDPGGQDLGFVTQLTYMGP